MFVAVRILQVFLWGERVGAMSVTSSGEVVFEYDERFRRRGLEISPFMIPTSTAKYYCSQFQLPRGAFYGLPGVFADSLPDSFGNRLVADWMKRNGIDIGAISPLDRLAYIGSRGMGALVYEPQLSPRERQPHALDMRRLVEEARLALNADLGKVSGEDALREIIRVGTSAGGAQAKAVVGWNRDTGEFRVGTEDLPEGFEHWIIKFSPPGTDFGEDEFKVYEKARSFGIDMSESCLYDFEGTRHFMTKRFDRDGNRRLHVETYCALKHLPMNAPRQLLGYEGLFETIAEMGLGYSAMEQMFRRMVFNIVNREMDDHTKNFSFLMDENGRWSLAPAYDLTGAYVSPGDEAMFEFTNHHALSVNGRFSSIRREDLLSLASRFGIGSAGQRVIADWGMAVGCGNLR